jgi:hypothetical protein
MEERKPRENSRENSRRGNNPRRNRKTTEDRELLRNSKLELLLSTVLLKLLRVDVKCVSLL